jgi:hypothetical protein
VAALRASMCWLAVLNRTVAAVENEFASFTGGSALTPTPVSATASGVASTTTVNWPDCAVKARL